MLFSISAGPHRQNCFNPIEYKDIEGCYFEGKDVVWRRFVQILHEKFYGRL
jgi:hypothetical protein